MIHPERSVYFKEQRWPALSRRHGAFVKPSRVIVLVCFGLLIGFVVGWHFGMQDRKARREQTIKNIRAMMLANKIYTLAYSNNPAAFAELLTNQTVIKS